mmetsp:Transcript_6417/g.15507  ORF Transcript_6417/g.15507 Transcript_6417/m.15507 type:complete len:311 (-) Transcript_6417:321-1253(-)|eukprot:CAMPEP_0114518296 /NCGR_PEP_ID=MMETSP0109-20121206/18368_1 /TAXON_ID=29199 /ORGANISM="Chlorarachnion reptans, Strain CCCM449" /LENGTH=310 /DNA_ID=CAMNT_0001698907 /DNA_START=92 /DNA_END=1024 /DNA_ORIENTATION=-
MADDGDFGLVLKPQRGASGRSQRGSQRTTTSNASFGGSNANSSTTSKNQTHWRTRGAAGGSTNTSAAATTSREAAPSGPYVPPSKQQEDTDTKDTKKEEPANEAVDESKGDSPIVFKPAEGESPLENGWCFWFDKRVRGARTNYESNLKRIGGFCTVEGMWSYLNHMVKPTQVELGANYHLFKENIKPMWEDKANANGGKWVVQIRDRGRQHLDTYWMNLVLGLAGETVDDGDEICGAVMSRRRQGDRISIWNRNKGSEEVIMHLGRKIKECISHSVTPSPSFTMEYVNHDDSIKTGHSYANPRRYTLNS